MSAISIARGFHPAAMFLICFLIAVFQIVRFADLAIWEKVLLLVLIIAMQLVVVTFEAWRIEKFEDEKDQGQIQWNLPGYYGFNLVKEEATCNPYKLDFNGYGEDE